MLSTYTEVDGKAKDSPLSAISFIMAKLTFDLTSV